MGCGTRSQAAGGSTPIKDALGPGGAWLVLSVLFEVVLGGLRGMSKAESLGAYEPFAPRLWDLVLLGMLLAPALVNRVRR